ncbi:hypothetical protein Saro_2994 [Novosphingobium aromaticivorans DSM 12444]|uniref:Peptidase M15A C-terminal domain-containing protein n=1 Tax=Novosphingobium aromaticivorans (strain ATCC 700278 / DSM 12444 / CCUG 56034 / CIP 105152 / NBRC 16084 / F199) TaxID=279238 RepID=Q2G3Z4_NOVAD|nr:D-Ala-D-Ala carboxypeptidase family metallohydrolase [Novosphingobium aromaticivorans]ABD27429.1 hypothetical protein Saro_2994 [Novosphingobium aromaticivorans DSM 12444]SCY69169.1 Peptidase M15 [Novosphingobium aromaticivorans]
MAELDYAAIMRAGQSLVPDIQEQMFLNDQRKMQQQARELQVQQARTAQERQVAFRTAAQQAAMSADPKAIGNLMIAFPEFADQIKPGWQALSEDARRRNLTQSGTVFMRAKNGDAKGAAALLRQRYEADLAAGHADETTKELIDAFESGDPMQVQQATATVGMILAADDPSKFADTYGKLFPSDDKSPFAKEYNDRVRLFGKEAADQWAATQDEKFIPVQQGGSVFRASDLMGGGGIVATREQQAESDRMRAMFPNAPQYATDSTKGGDQSTAGRGIAPTGSAIESAAMAAVPGLTVTSRQRSPGKNASVGGVDDSYHLTDQARDFVPPKGMGMGALRDRLAKAFPGFDVINEGDHVHIEPGKGTPHAAGPVRVRSVQEARKLPSGTMFVTPDGRTMRRP